MSAGGEASRTRPATVYFRPDMKNGNVICVFARYPEPGEVKVRLEKVIGSKQAAFLARAFLMDTISASLKVPRSDLYIAHYPPGMRDDFRDILYLFAAEERNRKVARKADSVNLIAQPEGDQGAKLKSTSKYLFENGAKRAVFLFSDSPLLQPLVIRAAFELLSKNQVVVGPTFEGRYYLLACDSHYQCLFDDIDWNSSSIYRETVTSLTKSGLKWQELELTYDVDGPEELEQLCYDIDNLRLTGEEETAYHTEKCLNNLRE